jgi:nitroimidazol reductase NimA-like FMN-containing flavoprotein (pyridoxamine 5'-phosphate oxidase superfamily)
MVIHELSHEECLAFLGRANQGRLGCSRAAQPYVVPFFFYLDETGAKVCVEADEIVDQHNWTSVLVFGRYQELQPDSDEDADERRRAHQLFQQRSEWWLPGLGKLTSGDEHHTPIVFRIFIDKLTGRRAGRAAHTK